MDLGISPTTVIQNKDYHLLLSIVALLLGFVFLYTLRSNVKTRRRKSKEIKQISNDNDGLVKLAENDGSTDVIIVGAGVAGAALACTLAKDGRRVHVIERDLTEPDRIVGELLQPGGYLKLIELGLEDCVDGIEAQQVFGYAIYMDGKNTKLSYPLEKFDSDISGRSFHNGRFIQRMREKAATLPNVKLEQGTVTSLLEKNGTVQGVCYKTKDGEVTTAYAPLTIVCNGCFSNLRRALCKPKGFFGGLAVWLLVCLLLKTAREVTRVVYLHHDSWWLSAVYLIASLLMWAYSAIIFLSDTALFNLEMTTAYR